MIGNGRAGEGVTTAVTPHDRNETVSQEKSLLKKKRNRN
jgi:hypothetical protein